MAFVRWRGNSAALLTTVYDKGRNRQVLLAALGCGYRVPAGVQAYVNEHFPHVFVDWDRVNQAMAQGPPSAAPLTKRQMTYVEMEQNLRSWARKATILPSEKTSLLTLAEILFSHSGSRLFHNPTPVLSCAFTLKQSLVFERHIRVLNGSSRFVN